MRFQWVDPSTVNMIQLILESPDIHHLLLIGAYRDNEVNDSHAFIKMVKTIDKKNRFDDIVLTPLKQESIQLIINDAFNTSSPEWTYLTDVVHQKTQASSCITYLIILREIRSL